MSWAVAAASSRSSCRSAPTASAQRLAMRREDPQPAALAIGPGMGRSDDRRQLVEEVLDSRGSRPVVVDADGLSVFAGDMDAKAAYMSGALKVEGELPDAVKMQTLIEIVGEEIEY